MFIVKDAFEDSSSVRSVMLTLRPYGTGVLLYTFNYKHCVPTGLLSQLLKGSYHILVACHF
ncbi:MAG: hypothetical protein V7641_637 [Blastocatellia bacterium]